MGCDKWDWDKLVFTIFGFLAKISSAFAYVQLKRLLLNKQLHEAFCLRNP